MKLNKFWKLNSNKKMIIALSGGPDSVFLFYQAILNLKNPQKQLVACHVNYNYRNDSINDQKFCENLCKKFHINIYTKVINQDYSKLEQNFEAWARLQRHKYFNEINNQLNFTYIIMGHNLNDYCETYIMQKQKHDIYNFKGIEQFIKLDNGLQIARPILFMSKNKILTLMNKLVVKNILPGYCIDKTNSDLSFTRNNIRNKMNDKDIKKILNQSMKENKKIRKRIDWCNEILKNINNVLNIKIEKDKIKFQTLIFMFLKNNGLINEIANAKKSRIKEIVKICESKKPFIEMNLKNILLIKDDNKLIILKKPFNKLIDEVYQKNHIEIYKNFYNWKNIEKIISDNNNIITNDWRKYKDFQVWNENFDLKTYFKKYKISYKSRFENLLVYNIKKMKVKILY